MRSAVREILVASFLFVGFCTILTLIEGSFADLSGVYLPGRSTFSARRSTYANIKYCPSVTRQLWKSGEEKNGFDDVDAIEKQIFASAQEKIDKRRVLEALVQDERDIKVSSLRKTSDGSSLAGREGDLESLPTPQWKVAAAAALASSSLAFFVTGNFFLSCVALITVFFAANGDPLDEGDSVAGAVARILGRATLRSMEASRPKVKAVARAVVTGEEELATLRARLREVERENADLRTWKERRIKVEER